MAKTNETSPKVTGAGAASKPSEGANRALDAIVARYAPPTAIQEQAYKSQFDDATCLDAGNKTRSGLVYAEASAWAVTIDKALRSARASSIKYTASRFAWFLRQVFALRDAIAAHKTAQGSIASAKTVAERAERTARHQEEVLMATLKSVAGEREEERAAIEAARSTAAAAADTAKPEALAARLEALADLGEGWLKKRDPVFQVLVEDSGLTKDLLESARATAATLATSRTSARGERVQLRDTASINLIEGRVLMEMRYAKNAFDAAHLSDPEVARLVPGPGTRAVLANHPKKTPKKSDPKNSNTPNKEDPAAAAAAGGEPEKKKPTRRKRRRRR